MPQSLSYILDDISGFISFKGQWNTSTLPQWYNGTSWSCVVTTGMNLGYIFLSFEGTSVAFIGTTPTGSQSQNATVSIDGSVNRSITYLGPPQYYQQWYISPSLADGRVHSIIVSNLASISVDFAVITAGLNTPLTGRTLIVDDLDSEIMYSGNWTQSPSHFNSATATAGFPYGGFTHRSSHIGDSFSFKFIGTSISIFGIFNWGNIGNLSATYILDGHPTSKSYPVTTASPEYVQQVLQVENYVLFSYDGLPAGTHTLVVNITQCKNQEFVLDYVTYMPSFKTLGSVQDPDPNASFAGMPVMKPVSTAPPFSITNSNSINQSATSASPESGSSSTNSSLSPTRSKDASIQVGTITGSVAGSVTFIVLSFLILWITRKRFKKRRELETVTAFNGEYSSSP